MTGVAGGGNRGKFPSKATGFLADLRYSCLSPQGWRIGGNSGGRPLPAKTCRQEWRHGTSGDVRHISLSPACLFPALPRGLVRYWIPFLIAAGGVRFVGSQGGASGSKCLKKKGRRNILTVGYRKQGFGAGSQSVVRAAERKPGKCRNSRRRPPGRRKRGLPSAAGWRRRPRIHQVNSIVL